MIVSRKPRKNESLSEQIDENDILLQKIHEDVNEEQEEEVINEEKSEEISLLKPVFLKKGERENKNSLVVSCF
jgi:DNA-binding transcriptional regulator GbsR (MarR family)